MIYLMTGPAAFASRPQWLPILQRAVDDADGRWTTEQLLEDVAKGDLMVWVVTRGEELRGVFTTRIVESRIRWLLIEDLAGDHLDEWIMEAQAYVEPWAREMGVKQIVIEGRKGWERYLRPFGYESTRIQAVKRLEVIQ